MGANDWANREVKIRKWTLKGWDRKNKGRCINIVSVNWIKFDNLSSRPKSAGTCK